MYLYPARLRAQDFLWRCVGDRSWGYFASDIFHASQDNETLRSVVHFSPQRLRRHVRCSCVFSVGSTDEEVMRHTLLWKEQNICGCISFLWLFVAQIQWLKITQMYYLTILEVRSLKIDASARLYSFCRL